MQGTRPARRLRGGIDLGGTKIEAIVVDSRNRVLGRRARPTPTSGGPADVAEEMAAAMREAAKAAGVEPDALRGVGVGSPGDVDERTGAVANARNLPGWDGAFALGTTLSDGARDAGLRRQRRPGRDQRRVQARRGQAVQVAARRLLGHRRRRRADPRRQAVARARRRRRDRPHGRQARRARAARAGAAAAWRPTRAAPRWRRAPGASTTRAPRPTCSS